MISAKCTCTKTIKIGLNGPLNTIYSFENIKNKFSNLKNPYLDTKINFLSHLEAEKGNKLIFAKCTCTEAQKGQKLMTPDFF